MARFIFFITLFLSLISSRVESQTKQDFDAVNEVWAKFYLAFESLEYSLMAEIHAKDLVRISNGTRILDYDQYIYNYKEQFEKANENQTTYQISLRFFERLSNGQVASERGIYKLTITDTSKEEKSYYGAFHVILKNDNGWKIIMDYDSNEGGTIGETEYAKAQHIHDFESFYSKQ